jgi:hypothetical protein
VTTQPPASPISTPPPDRPFALVAVDADTTTVRLGPASIAEAVELIDNLLTPNGYTPRFESWPPAEPLGLAAAWRRLTIAPGAAVESTDLFRALRAAIVADMDDGDGIDSTRAALLITHIEPHRPLQMWTGDEDCLRGECALDPDHKKCDIQPADQVCAACTPAYDHGGDWGVERLQACWITWPCAPLRAVAGHYQVPLPEQATTDG